MELFYISFAILWIYLSYKIAKDKGYDLVLAGILGFKEGLITVIIYLLLPKKVKNN